MNDLEPKEIQLRGRKFTWTNNITHTRIDRAFCTIDWEVMLPNCRLQSISSLVSDHRLLFLTGDSNLRKYGGFRFESFWPEMRGIQRRGGSLAEAWSRHTKLTQPFLEAAHKNAAYSVQYNKRADRMGKSKYWVYQTALAGC
jgi:hypothetical protein